MNDERIRAIRERLANATPGPWKWAGYTDGSIELRTVGRGGQRVVTSHRAEPCLVELLDGSIALSFYACDSCQAEAKKSHDPWVDYRCPKEANLDTVWLRDADAGFIRPANHWAVPEVSYRTDVASVEHPDAAFIAAAPDDIAYLLERLEQLEASERRLRDALETVWVRLEHGAVNEGARFLLSGVARRALDHTYGIRMADAVGVAPQGLQDAAAASSPREGRE